jgi:ankyrin repeat protein
MTPRSSNIYALTIKETTPLHIALRAKSMDIVNFLLKKGARVDIVEKNWNGGTVFLLRGLVERRGNTREAG